MPDISKTNLSPADVLRITEASLGREAADSEPLTAGQCNALYAVTLSDGSRCVLKIAPDPALRLRRGERWLMQTETAAMRLAQTLPGVPLPRILAEDRTCALCPAPFFIMEYAPGHSAALDRPRWSAEEHDRWYRRFGEMIRAIAEARAPSFGIVASGRTFSTLSAFAGDMLEMVLADCRDFGVDTGADADEILARFGRETAFGCVTEPPTGSARSGAIPSWRTASAATPSAPPSSRATAGRASPSTRPRAAAVSGTTSQWRRASWRTSSCGSTRRTASTGGRGGCSSKRGKSCGDGANVPRGAFSLLQSARGFAIIGQNENRTGRYYGKSG